MPPVTFLYHYVDSGKVYYNTQYREREEMCLVGKSEEKVPHGRSSMVYKAKHQGMRPGTLYMAHKKSNILFNCRWQL
jgi:hypothetical protein